MKKILLALSVLLLLTTYASVASAVRIPIPVKPFNPMFCSSITGMCCGYIAPDFCRIGNKCKEYVCMESKGIWNYALLREYQTRRR